MTARILVVDDSTANLKLLRAMLASEYMEVIIARDGPEALVKLAECNPDVALLDVMMPGMDGFEVCRRIKSAPSTSPVPVVMLTTLDQPEDRFAALEAGADDFMTKPLNRPALIALVRNLVRHKAMIDVLRMRERSGGGGARAGEPTMMGVSIDPGRVLLIGDQRGTSDAIRLALLPRHRVHVEKDSEDALLLVRRAEFDLLAVDLSLAGADALRVCARLRALAESRYTPVLAIANHDAEASLRALELGVNGCVAQPLHPGELLARVDSQLRRKRYWDALRDGARKPLEWAGVDPLTRMHDRRYLERYLGALVSQNVERGRPVSLLFMDVDHLDAVNDTYDHEVGDEVLREVARRISSSLRGLDLSCRFGGEEFVAAFSGVDVATARRIGERLRESVAGRPFPIATEDGPLHVTISVGSATTSSREDTADALLDRADLALYRAKKDGCNRVVACDA